MATAPATRRSAAIARIAKTLTIKIDGEDIFVPVGKAQNKVMSCLLVAQTRGLVEASIKKIKDLDQPISPRELKDLVDAVGKLTEAAAEVYKDLDGELDQQGEKPADKVKEEPAIEADFKILTQTQEDGTTAPQPRPSSHAATDGGAPNGE